MVTDAVTPAFRLLIFSANFSSASWLVFAPAELRLTL